MWIPLQAASHVFSFLANVGMVTPEHELKHSQSQGHGHAHTYVNDKTNYQDAIHIQQAWAAASHRAEELVAQMTLHEKINLTSGVSGPCQANSGSVPRLGVPSFCYNDGRECRREREFCARVVGLQHMADTICGAGSRGWCRVNVDS
jgi:hypothetical protein